MFKKSSIKSYIITGLLIWVPLVITLWVLNLLVGTLDQTLQLLPQSFLTESWLGVHVPGLGVILTVLIVLVTGMITANMLSRATAGLPLEPSMMAHTAATSMMMAATVRMMVPAGSPKCSASRSACAIARAAHATMLNSSQPVHSGPAGSKCASTRHAEMAPMNSGHSASHVGWDMRSFGCMPLR